MFHHSHSCAHSWMLPAFFLCGAAFVFLVSAAPQKSEPGLLFHLSASQGFKADFAVGNPEPNFLENVKIIPGGTNGPAFQCAHNQLMSYWAPGNIYAQRGTLSFYWRSREPVGKTQFPIFRVAFADHSSWDMVWLRIDYNGHGFDAFVTDANLVRIRVSTTLSPFPAPDQWTHLALSWDETVGIRFHINGHLAAHHETTSVLYSGLDQFGPHSRIIAPWQVQSAYNFVRGGDLDELRIYDRMLPDAAVVRLSQGQSAGDLQPLRRDLSDSRWQAEWRLRYGWNRQGDFPPYLDQLSTRVRKVEIQDVYDLKRWWWKGVDGIRETTWPGVYNRSRLPGRNDYFQLPDWDCYSLSGKAVTFFMPDEPWNHLEISGAAWGDMTLLKSDSGTSGEQEQLLFRRPPGQEKTVHRVSQAVRGQRLRFTNVEQETPIGELSAYYVDAGKEPAGIATLSYVLAPLPEPAPPQLQPLTNFIAGRYLPDERSTLMAVPQVWPEARRRTETRASLPLVHILIPCNLQGAGGTGSDSSCSWSNIHGGLDGIAIDLPPMKVRPTHGDLYPLNIQVKDPIWPMRNMLDFSFSVKPRQAHTLWLDLRDRILPEGKSIYLTIAAAGGDFGPGALQDARIRLIFKPWQEARHEHIQDRFTQVRDNYAQLLEERPRDKRFNLYNRFEADITDLLRVDPNHYPGLNYWYDIDREHPKPPFVQPIAPEGIPLWAFRQVEDLRYFTRFVLWWIDHRQIDNGEFGGGLSDDDDLTNCWPAAALMGCQPAKVATSVLKMMEAIYRQGMFTQGLATIQTDGLHAHEEGIEAQTQAMLVDYGNPRHVERMMETVRALDERIILRNPAGHRHFRSNYFSGTKIAEEGVWEWPQAQIYLLLQPALTLVEFNGHPRARQLATDVADGLLAHARKDESGRLIIDTEINFATDASRPSQQGSRSMLASSMGSGTTFSTSSAALQLLWAVYRFTGDPKYLQPLLDMGEGVIGSLPPNALDLAGLRGSFGSRIAASTLPTDANDFFRHIAWQMTGNKAYLESYYADQIQASALREYINTEGHPWSDRAVVANRELQRSRLGGIALVRGAIVSGHAVSWNFKAPATEESVAILIPESTPSAIKIIVYALEPKTVDATLTAWGIEPGQWQVSQGVDTNGDDMADGEATIRQLQLERGGSVPLSFPGRKTTILMLRLRSGATPYWKRPDLGIGKDDVIVEGNTLKVQVHSLGAVAAPASTLALVKNGITITRVPIPPIDAPLDLMPRRSEVILAIPPGTDLRGCSVQIDPDGKITEVTLANNRIEL
jgi:hypothetical protein